MPWRATLLLLSCLYWLAPCACSKKTEGPAVLSSFEPFPEGDGKEEKEHWHVIELQGKPAGWTHARVVKHDTKRGPRWVTTSEEITAVRRGVEKMEARTQERYLENERGQLLRFWQMEQEQDGEKVVIQAGKVEANMVTVRGPEIRRVPFEPQAFGTQRYYQILFTGKAPEAGEVRKFRSYDSTRAGYADDRIVVKSAGPQTTELEHTSTTLPGVVAKV